MKFKIGVDGGGTKTEGVLVDAAGNVAAIHVGAGSNPSLVGAERARSVVAATLDSLRAQAGGIAVADGSKPVIGTVMRQGYKIGELVLRPAMVGVVDTVADAQDAESQ